jgi:L-asparaginase
MKKIKLFITGGSIDKRYNEISERMVLDKTHIPKMLEISRVRLNITTEELMLVDSLDIKEPQRQKILEACQNEKAKHSVITHGTSTIVETAKLLGKNIQDKTIVLLGAMIPYSLIDSSDALFNLGCAVNAVQTLDKGVYITMNGRIFSWENVMKDTKLGEFKEVD